MKRTIRSKVQLLIMLMTNIFFVQSAKASHTMGADLTYKCLGGNTYKITLSFYRDCIGIPAPTNPFVKITSASCGQNLGVTCYARPGTGQEVTPTCSSAVTTCNGGAFTGIQEWIYDGIITLPMQCTDWVFSYNLCCRNAAITNITSPGSNTFYIYATLNNIVSPCNSSPTFSNKPVPFLCVGQQYCFNHGANDADGDSLSYSLITPKQTAGTTVNYISPYTAYNPLNSVPTTTFNTYTGDICLTPQSLQVTVMAVLVNEYRNGVLIGSVERDLQLTVMNCNNTLPTLTGINGTNNFSMTVCAGQPTCFTIYSNDVDTGQDLTVTWDHGIANATFTTTASQHPVSTFCWTPTAADISNTPHVFTAHVADDACPYFGSQIYSYSITVKGITVNAGVDQNIACSDLATLTATASGGSGTYSYLWSNGSTMRSITVGAGTYFVTANDGTCSAIDTVVVSMPYIPTASFTASPSACLNSPIHFYDSSSTPGGVLDSWYWDFGDNTNSTLQNPVHQYSSPGTYHVSLLVGNTLGCYDTIIQQIVIKSLPVASFIGENDCTGQHVLFINHSTHAGSVHSWNWNFGDGAVSNSHNGNHIYNSPGTYLVTLTIGDSSTCSDTASQLITIYPPPAANAGVDQNICSGNSATLIATGGDSYHWSPSGGNSSTLTVSPGNTTSYTVEVTDSNGCSANDTVTVIIHPPPTANAGPDKNICIGNSVSLTATGGTNYNWNPGGVTTATISVNPTSDAVYVVTVTDANGCSATDNAQVHVNPLPTAIINPVVDICAGSGTTLTASGGISYSWLQTGSTTSTISVSPSSSSTFTVIVADGNGCVDSADAFVNVHPAPVVSLQSFFLCSGSLATLNAGNPGSTYLWTPSGDTTQAIQINSGGTYAVTVTDHYGCSATASCDITTGTSLTINMGNISFCQGDSAVFDAGHPGMSYLWSPNGDTSQTIIVHTAGTYGVVVTDTNGCSGSISSNAQINPIPVANFSANNVCEGDPVSFTDLSMVAGGSIAAWSWSFGDGAVSVQRHPTHQYTSAGTYSVTLHVSSADGCIKTITKNTVVHPLPLVDFSFSNSCQGSTVPFNDQSNVSSGNISSYAWNFGDGFTSHAQNPRHQFSPSGNYTVSLQLTTAAGCANSTTQTIVVYPKPSASFSSAPVCLGNQSMFNDASGISTGWITNFKWNLGDSSISTLHQTVHTYSSAGIFEVGLTVTSNNGCIDSIFHPVLVNTLPAAYAGKDEQICFGTIIDLTASGGTNYTWLPGSFHTQSISINPTSSSIYTVSVIDSNGCEASDDVLVTVVPLPHVDAGANQSICLGGLTTLTATGGVTYSWSPGDSTGSTLHVQPITSTNYVVTAADSIGCKSSDTVMVFVNTLPHVQAEPDRTICIGSSISLVATGAFSYTWNPGGSSSSMILVTPPTNTSYSVTGIDVNGCISSDTINVFISPVPVVNIPFALMCEGSSAVLNAGNTGSTYSWSTGEISQSISVADTGNYSVVVTLPNGCSTLGNTHAGIDESPVANFSARDVCMNSPMNFNNGSSVSSGHISTWFWNFGDNTSSMIQNPSHEYINAGTYQVTLIVTTSNGCSSSIHSIVHVLPNPVAAFTATNVCFSNATQFFNQSSATGTTNFSSYWEFSDGTISTLTDPGHAYTSPGSYDVSLIVTSVDGCTNKVIHSLDIYLGPSVSFHANDACLGTPTLFIDNSSSTDGVITSWHWDFGDGAQSMSSAPSHIYQTEGRYNVTLTSFTSYGCYSAATRTVEVYPVPDPRIRSNNACVGTSVEFADQSNNLSTNDVIYHWDLGDNFTSGDSVISHAYQLAGAYDVLLVASTPNGCNAEDRMQVTIYPKPDVSIHATDVCFPGTTRFTNATSISSGTLVNYTWDFGDGQSGIAINPMHAYAATGTYVVALTTSSDHGCMNADTVQLRINPNPLADFGGAVQGCSPLHARFIDSSWIAQGTITAWLWDFGNGEFSTQQNPSYTFSQSGVFPVTLHVVSDQGCTASYTIPDFISVFPKPDAAFGADPLIVDIFNPVIHFDNTSQNYTSWSWNFGDGTTTDVEVSPTHAFADTGSYTAQLIILNSYGCRDTAFRTIEVTPHSTLFAPNCFTPNGDGKNDSFKPYFLQMNTIQVWIFNRWGELLANWDGLDGFWDGYYKGHPCQEDVYVYRIKGLGADRKSYEWTGHVSIVH